MNVPEETKLNEIVNKLCGILRIQDWNTSVEVVSAYEFNQTTGLSITNSGAADRNVRLNKATVYLNKDADDDWYETLVHELLHIQATPLIHCAKAYFEEEHSYFNDLYEQFTEKQAQVFCNIYPLSMFTPFKGVQRPSFHSAVRWQQAAQIC